MLGKRRLSAGAAYEKPPKSGLPVGGDKEMSRFFDPLSRRRGGACEWMSVEDRIIFKNITGTF